MNTTIATAHACALNPADERVAALISVLRDRELFGDPARGDGPAVRAALAAAWHGRAALDFGEVVRGRPIEGYRLAPEQLELLDAILTWDRLGRRSRFSRDGLYVLETALL